MKIVKEKITRQELKKMSEKMFGGLVKAVVDVEKKILVIDAPMHADQEALLIKRGSKQQQLWGINLYPNKKGKDFIEFDSIINLRPSNDNRSRGVDNPQIRQKIISMVKRLVVK